jgi:uncharacterized protein (TIGR02145 family)
MLHSVDQCLVILGRWAVAPVLVIGFAAAIAGQPPDWIGEVREEAQSVRLADGRLWTSRNLVVRISGSFCYDDLDSNCALFGRLYTWQAAHRACTILGKRWRLPDDAEWRRMALRYGGIVSDSKDKGANAYRALMPGGQSGFNAILGGGRDVHGQFARAKAHGFYWSASRSEPGSGWFYNFGSGSRLLNRHSAEISEAFAVRCIKD